MSIVEQFGRKKPQEAPRQEPALPTNRQPPNEKHAQALLFVSDLTEQVQRLTDTNNGLRADLNLTLMRNRDLEEQNKQLRRDMEMYRRYSVEVKTHLQNIIDVCRRANDAAIEAGENLESDPVSPLTGKTADQVIDGIADDLAKAEGPK